MDDRDYQVPFAFTGKIDKLTIALDEPKLTPDDLKKLETAYRAARMQSSVAAVRERENPASTFALAILWTTMRAGWSV